MWVLDGRDDALFAYDLAERRVARRVRARTPPTTTPQGIWSDGISVWVSDHNAEAPLRLPPARRSRRPTRRTRPRTTRPQKKSDLALERVRDEEFTKLPRVSNNSPRGLWSDGEVMYVADASDGKVYSYNMPDAIDARLDSLTLSGVDIGEFDPGRPDYEAVVADGVTETTVEAEAAQSAATVEIAPADADEDADGHQVAVADGSEITVTVTSDRTRAAGGSTACGSAMRPRSSS